MTDDQEMRLLVESQERRVQKLARRFSGGDLAFREDLAQEARLAVWRAYEEWDPERGMGIQGYVHSRIEWALHNYLATRADLVRAPVREFRAMNRISTQGFASEAASDARPADEALDAARISHRARNLVVKSLLNMKWRRREAVLHMDIEGENASLLSEQIGRSVSSIHELARAGRRDLREWLPVRPGEDYGEWVSRHSQEMR